MSNAHKHSTFPRWNNRLKRKELTPATLTYTFAEPTQADQAPAEKEKTRERSRQLLRRSSNASVSGSIHTFRGMSHKQSGDTLSVRSGYGDLTANDDTASIRSVGRASISPAGEPVSETQDDVTEGSRTPVTFQQPPAAERVPLLPAPTPAPAPDIPLSPTSNPTPGAPAEAQPLVPPPSQSAPALPSESGTPGEAAIPDTSNHDTIRARSTNNPAANANAASSSSWFQLFTWSKEALPETNNSVPIASTSADADASSAVPPQPLSHPHPHPHNPVEDMVSKGAPAAPQPTEVDLSLTTAPSTTPRDVRISPSPPYLSKISTSTFDSTRPPHSSRPSIISIPSSVDEEVPVLSPSVHFPPPTIGGPPTITHGQEESEGSGGGRRRTQSTHTLNPSTSRFMLSIPLLGRPKVPLDKAVAAAQAEDIRVTDGEAKDESKAEEGERKRREQGSEGTRRDDTKTPSMVGIQPEPTSSTLTTATSSNLPPAPPNSTIDLPNAGLSASVPSDPVPPDATTTTIVTSASAASSSNLNTTNEPAEQATWWDFFSWKATTQESAQPAAVAATTTDETSEAQTTNADVTVPTEGADEQSSVAAEPSASPEVTVEGIPTGDDQPPPHPQPERAPAGRERSSSAPPTSPILDRKNPVDEGKLRAHEVDVLSARSAQSQQSQSAWYAPWGWYQSSASLPPSGEPTNDRDDKDGKDVGEADKAEGKADESATGPTPSNAESSAQAQGQAKTEDASASAPDATASSTAATTADPADPSGDPATAPSSTSSGQTQSQTRSALQMQNPIEASASTSRSGWIAFFSARGAASKRITDGSEAQEKEGEGGKGEMEVMDLDLDEDGNEIQGAGAVGSGSDAKDGKDDQGTVKGKEAQPSGSKFATPQAKSPRPASPAASQRPDSPANSVLSDKDAAKRKHTSSIIAGDRAPSPAPSKKSSNEKVKGDKDVPRPPNLILPTWGDTFHLPPRSVVPPSYLKASASASAKAGQGQESSLAMAKSAALRFVSKAIWAPLEPSAAATDHHGQAHGVGAGPGMSKAKGKWKAYEESLPRAYDVLEGKISAEGAGNVLSNAGDVLKGAKRVVVIGVHGWFPGAAIRTVLGEPTGTSAKFTSMMTQALELFQAEHGVRLDKVTSMPLEGEGTIVKRVERLYAALTGNKEWMDDLREADVVFVATHSQGSIVSTHLLDRLIRDGYIRTEGNGDAGARPDGEDASRNGSVTQSGGADASLLGAASAVAGGAIGIVPGPWRGRGQAASQTQAQDPSGTTAEDGKRRKPHRVCCLALCGIHHGPLRYLSTSSLLQPYLQYFENTAARELFEFQNTESSISKEYLAVLQNVLHHKVKMVYVASLNDQVVGLYSGLFTAVSHPLILRGLYIDGDAYHSSDFLSNLLVLLLRIRNAGLSDSGLLTHLSEATAGSLNGIGHSTVYEEIATFSLAVNYLFLTDDGPRWSTQPNASSGRGTKVQDQAQEQGQDLVFTSEPFDALKEQNDYEIPWALRDLIADEDVARLFSDDFIRLRDAFRDWQPKTSILRDVKRKLQPIQRLSSAVLNASGSPPSSGGSLSRL
ncbi:hypothetical protein CONPUDRAFT_132566 [Coniophora puteana RWD-64-598 SS2]|uniref:YMC020W-like alpha/beta hydrolase domain-containing protein n=1 Tax=Coniophora puteana (strain RWD-64-598) TaxID=741705 RepID=A0A5M3M7E7_CONPW|nr:uncharacterized protein CONPUDRAFT_132566 [Coniophora puteana RWD-64-598 SS2]EIW74973.1 hypothetical protein CONPUDRAFT_132566 [Coniophora puteana RWD-64-598 SS2]